MSRTWVVIGVLLLLALVVGGTPSTWGAEFSTPPAGSGGAWAPATGRATVVAIDGDRWLINGEVTYPGQAAQGLLMNVRMVNSVFEDDRPKDQWPSALPQDFDPEANTDAFIARLPEYVEHGVLGFTLNLQGGSPKYERAHNSAYNSDGSLRPAYLGRVKRVIEAADEQGAVIILGLFYQRQHHQSPTFNPRSLEGQGAIRAAVENVAQWVKDNGFTNVVLEISNEHGHSGFGNWHDGDWLRSVAGQVELMELARQTHPGLLVSTSGMGNGTIPSGIAQAADFVLIHTNNTSLSDYPSRIAAARSYGKPVVINEDDKLGNSGAQAAQLAVEHGAGWGAMLWDKNQAAPFEFDGAADDPTIYAKIHDLTGGGPKAPLAVKLAVVVTEPHDGQSFVLGQPVKLTASPTAPSGGTVSRVEFYANSQKVGERTASPWSMQWTSAEAGHYDIWARVLDDQGDTADSQPVDIIVVALAPASPSEGLQAHWRFEEGVGRTAFDSSDNDNHGTLNNMDASTAWVTGKLGAALAFDGTNDHVSVPNSSELQLSSEITIAAWINPASDGGEDKRILNKQRSATRSTYSLQYNPGSGVHFNLNDCSNNFDDSGNFGSLPMGQWSHVSATFQDSTGVAIIYIDGTEAGRSLISLTPCATDTGALYIGGHPGHNQDRWFKGKIDDVRIYNRALSPEEVANLAEPNTTPQPVNQPPVVDAGPHLEVTLASPAAASLSPVVTDDGLPNPPGALTLAWSLVSGPGAVSFADPAAALTTATFTQAGNYVLRLTADDGEFTTSDELTVTVNPEPADKEVSSDPLTISDLTVASGKHYQVVYDGLDSGARLYIDRSFTFSSPPDAVAGATYIMTANDDKSASQENFLSFQVNQPVTVYVAYDARFSAPDWLAGWTPTGEVLNTTDTLRNIFAKDFPKGSVTLGGNNTSSSGSHYSVIVIGQSGDSSPANQTPAVDAGPDLDVTLPAAASLKALVSDDGLPNPPGALTLAWSLVSGPGTVSFADPKAAATTATFSHTGTYLLRLTANDGDVSASDEVAVTVAVVYGDANLDGRLTSEDVYLLVDWLLGETPMPEPGTPAFIAVDVNGDGKVSISDIDLMVKRLSGEIDQFSVED